MTDRMAVAMAPAIANRMAKPMRFGWQNDAPNPNPNPNPTSAVAVCSCGAKTKSNLSVSYGFLGLEPMA